MKQKIFKVIIVCLLFFGSLSISPQSSKAAATFIWPAEGVITSNFGYRSSPSPGFHYGIDIAKNGDYVPIKSSAPGTVIRSDYSSSYGNVVYVRHYINGEYYVTVYAHMRSRAVSVNDAVSQGQLLGYMGSTGNSTGQHLHFELHKGTSTWNRSYAVNPINYLGKELAHENPPGIGTAVSIYPENYGVNYYSAPNGTYKGRIYAPTRYIVYQQRDGWIDLGNNSWVKMEHMEFTRYTARSKYPENYGVNYYSAPNGTYKGRIYAPTRYWVYNRVNGWVDIGQSNWIPEEHLIIE